MLTQRMALLRCFRFWERCCYEVYRMSAMSLRSIGKSLDPWLFLSRTRTTLQKPNQLWSGIFGFRLCHMMDT